jgi:hypothetical protein
MWIKLYGDNPEGIPAEWPMEVRENGPSPGKDWIEMDRKQYDDYRKLHEAKKELWNKENVDKGINFHIADASQQLMVILLERGVISEDDFTVSGRLDLDKAKMNTRDERAKDQFEPPVKPGTTIGGVYSRVEMFNDIFYDCEDTDQLTRIIDALDANPSFISALDNGNYDLARNRLDKALQKGDLLEQDHTLIISKFPVVQEEIELAKN